MAMNMNIVEKKSSIYTLSFGINFLTVHFFFLFLCNKLPLLPVLLLMNTFIYDNITTTISEKVLLTVLLYFAMDM